MRLLTLACLAFFCLAFFAFGVENGLFSKTDHYISTKTEFSLLRTKYKGLIRLYANMIRDLNAEDGSGNYDAISDWHEKILFFSRKLEDLEKNWKEFDRRAKERDAGKIEYTFPLMLESGVINLVPGIYMFNYGGTGDVPEDVTEWKAGYGNDETDSEHTGHTTILIMHKDGNLTYFNWYPRSVGGKRSGDPTWSGYTAVGKTRAMAVRENDRMQGEGVGEREKELWETPEIGWLPLFDSATTYRAAVMITLLELDEALILEAFDKFEKRSDTKWSVVPGVGHTCSGSTAVILQHYVVQAARRGTDEYAKAISALATSLPEQVLDYMYGSSIVESVSPMMMPGGIMKNLWKNEGHASVYMDPEGYLTKKWGTPSSSCRK